MREENIGYGESLSEMPLDNLHTADIEKEVVAGNSAVIKKVNVKKILIIIAACLAALIAVFLIYLYGGSQYKLSEETMNKLAITSKDAKLICNAYKELDRECRLSKLFNTTLDQEITSNQFKADIYLRTLYDEYLTNSRTNMINDLRFPLVRKRFFAEVDYEEACSDKSVNEKYRSEIQEALKIVKEKYCK